MRALLLGPFLKWARTLRFPTLFKLVGALFVINLFIPDPLPFFDEIVLALGTLLLASWKDRHKMPEGVVPEDGRTIDGNASRQ